MKTIIQTPANNIVSSAAFYKKLNYKIVSKKNPYILSDGKVIIELNQNKFIRVSLKIIRDNWQPILKELNQQTSVAKIENGYLLADPSGCWIYLIEDSQMKEFDLSEIPPSTLGNFAGISLESIAIEKSVLIYQILGFKINSGDINQVWISMINEEGMTISLMKANMCPHQFFNPSLTYFNGSQNLAIIEKIRTVQIPITEEITQFNTEGIVDNIIIRDPGGLGFFIFND